jgi:hypothetical protein
MHAVVRRLLTLIEAAAQERCDAAVGMPTRTAARELCGTEHKGRVTGARLVVPKMFFWPYLQPLRRSQARARAAWMRRGGGGYVSPRSRAGGAHAHEAADAAALPTPWLVACCEGLLHGVMSCLEALFGCGALGGAEAAAQSPPRLRRASPQQQSGERLLQDVDDASSPLEPPSIERLVRSSPSSAPSTPRGLGVALEPLALPRGLEVEDDDDEDTREKKRAALRDRPEECLVCLEVRAQRASLAAPPRPYAERAGRRTCCVTT